MHPLLILLIQGIKNIFISPETDGKKLNISENYSFIMLLLADLNKAFISVFVYTYRCKI